MLIGVKSVSEILFLVASAYDGNGQFSPSLPYVRPSRNPVYSSWNEPVAISTGTQMYRAIDEQHSAIGRSLSLDQPSGTPFQTSYREETENTFRLSLKMSLFRKY